MARFIFISPYLKGGKDAARISNRTRYIATREGVELLRSDSADLAPTDKQEAFIARALRQFPEARKLLEYEDYRDAPSRKTAGTLIEQLWEQYVLTLEGRENFLDYVSHRPGVKSDGDHGLWDANGKVQNLSDVVREVANHQGNVWTPVVSMRREDAERLGYTDVENWRAVVNACVSEIAEGYKISPDHLRWYAALHEKEAHVHIHMIVYSTDPKEGYLTKEGMAKLATKTVERKDGGTETQVLCTSENFRLIFENDPHFANVRFDALKGYPVKVDGNKRVAWIDADDAESRTYIEMTYGISNRQKCEDGFLVFLQSRRFQPVQERLDKLEWDGQPHCEQFFIKWMGAADEPYTRETSRLFFAGGVHRAYCPGSKFDCVLTLQDKQGSGKSTMARWLAIEDDFYTSTKTISGMRGLESILAKWIIELEELSATLANDHSGTKQEEAAKAFLSTQSDYYRQPYARRPEEHPRSCIFIGTTNRMEFLSDKSGNRRWYPLRLDSDSEFIYEREAEIKADILQCWAEMVTAYKAKEPFASPTARTDMLSEIKTQQADAEVDDYRAGLIEQYLDGKSEVCLFQIWKDVFYRDALSVPKMTRTDSVELAEILVNTLHWKRGSTKVFEGVGRQKSFLNPVTTDNEDADSLPF